MGIVASTPRIIGKVTWDYTNMHIPTKDCVRTWYRLCACPFWKEIHAQFTLHTLWWIIWNSPGKILWHKPLFLAIVSNPREQLNFTCTSYSGRVQSTSWCVCWSALGRNYDQRSCGWERICGGITTCEESTTFSVSCMLGPWEHTLLLFLNLPIRTNATLFLKDPMNARIQLMLLASPCDDWLYHGLWREGEVEGERERERQKKRNQPYHRQPHYYHGCFI